MAKRIKKATGKRWGKKFKDNRDWVAYNEELVVRGEFHLDMEWVNNWDCELEKMNEGKRGAPYEFPESLIKLQGVWHQWVDYRGIEGITRKLAEPGLIPKYNDFSTISRRVNSLDLEFRLPESGACCAACDGSGMKFENSGEYRARMYGKRRKYVKVVITADPVKKELLGCEVSVEGEGSSEPEIAREHMERLLANGIRIDKFWGDGSFDAIDLFQFLEANSITPAIRLRKNAVQSGNNTLRDREQGHVAKNGYKKWRDSRGYGLRWPGTEGIFSAVKRKFGECIKARAIDNALKEAKMKFWAYETIKGYAKARA